MEANKHAGSTDELWHGPDDADGGSPNSKAKNKRPGVLGKLKDRIFGHKKRRTRSHDSAKEESHVEAGTDKSKSTTELTEGPDQHPSNVNAMSISVNSVFSPAEGLNLPKSGIGGLKDTSASLEALSSGSNFKSELERKLINRRSLDDDGLPGSPVGTPTTGDIMAQASFMKNQSRKSQDPYRIDRDSDGSLLSIGSSENEEDAFFKNPWKGAQTSAIRRPRRGTLSSDSEDDTLDFDAVVKTESLTNSAAMHKRNVRPRHRAKARRVITSTPGQMPSLAEKKTLEIAHAFLDEGKTTPVVKVRNLEQGSASPSLVTVRRTDSDKTYNSPSQQRKSDPTVINESKSPKPVARSATTGANLTSRKPSNEEQSSHQNELLSVLQRFKPQTPTSSTESKPDEPSEPCEPKSTPIAKEPSTPRAVDGEQVPPRPAKSVGFSSTPPIQRRTKPPAVQPRPKSMFPQQTRSKTLEVKSSNVEEALSHLSYSKSFNAPEASKPSNGPIRQKQPSDDEKTKSLPEWTKLAKRKTWAVSDPDAEQPVTTTETVVVGSRPAPVPVPRYKGVNTDTNKPAVNIRPTNLHKPESSADATSELKTKLAQVHVRSEANDSPGATNDSFKKSTSPISNDRHSLYSPIAGFQPTKSDKGPSISNRKTMYDNVTLPPASSPYGHFSERKSPDEAKPNKETIVISKSKPVVSTASTPEETKNKHEDQLVVLAEPPWKTSLKLRTGSLKTAPVSITEGGSAGAPTPLSKPSWKSATLKERSTPPSAMMSSSTEALDEILASQAKSRTLELPVRKPNPMTVSESSAYSKDSSPLDDQIEGEELKSFRDRLKMFQSK